MKVLSTTQLVDIYREPTAAGAARDYTKEYERATAALRAEYPVLLGRCITVNYDTKSDRYVGKFGTSGSETCSVKLEVEVAKFLLANLTIRTTDGREITGVCYLKLDKKGAAEDVIIVTL